MLYVAFNFFKLYVHTLVNYIKKPFYKKWKKLLIFLVTFPIAQKTRKTLFWWKFKEYLHGNTLLVRRVDSNSRCYASWSLVGPRSSPRPPITLLILIKFLFYRELLPYPYFSRMRFITKYLIWYSPFQCKRYLWHNFNINKSQQITILELRSVINVQHIR